MFLVIQFSTKEPTKIHNFDIKIWKILADPSSHPSRRLRRLDSVRAFDAHPDTPPSNATPGSAYAVRSFYFLEHVG